MYSESKLREIFYSSQHTYSSDRTILFKLAFLIKNNYLKVKKKYFCNKNYYLDLASDKNTREDIDTEGGSPQHVALKVIAAEYLLSNGFESKIEFPFCGYTPGVITADKQTIVECGHTDNVDKIFIYYTQRNIAKLIQLPYPDEAEAAVYGYGFTPNSALKHFLNETMIEDKEKIIKILNRQTR